MEARQDVEKGLRQIRALTGSAPDVALPTNEDFEKAAVDRLQDLEPLLHRIPFTPEMALRALDRVDAKLPPARASQQYKDCAIWEACLVLADEFDVHLVTEDKAFFENGQVQRSVLDPQLQAECQAHDVEVTIYSSLKDALVALAENAVNTFDPRPVVEALEEAARELAKDPAAKHALVLGERRTYRLKAFVTEKRDVLSVTFTLMFQAFTEAVEPAIEGSVTVEGQALYSADSGAVMDVRPDRIKVGVSDEEGAMAEHIWIYGVGALVAGGAPPMPHTLRAPLPGGGEFNEPESEAQPSEA
jgi:hypothetical protein